MLLLRSSLHTPITTDTSQQRLHIATIVHTLVFLELGQHTKLPPVAATAKPDDSRAGVHAACQQGV